MVLDFGKSSEGNRYKPIEQSQRLQLLGGNVYLVQNHRALPRVALVPRETLEYCSPKKIETARARRTLAHDPQPKNQTGKSKPKDSVANFHDYRPKNSRQNPDTRTEKNTGKLKTSLCLLAFGLAGKQHTHTHAPWPVMRKMTTRKVLYNEDVSRYDGLRTN